MLTWVILLALTALATAGAVLARLGAVPPCAVGLAPPSTVAVVGEAFRNRFIAVEDAGDVVQEASADLLAELGVVLGEEDVFVPHLVHAPRDGAGLAREAEDDETLVFTFGIVQLPCRVDAFFERVLLHVRHVPRHHRVRDADVVEGQRVVLDAVGAGRMVHHVLGREEPSQQALARRKDVVRAVAVRNLLGLVNLLGRRETSIAGAIRLRAIAFKLATFSEHDTSHDFSPGKELGIELGIAIY